MIKGVLYNVGTTLTEGNQLSTVVMLVLTDESMDDVTKAVASIGKEFVIVEAPAIPE